MKILELDINGIGKINNLNIKFDPQMNIICGPNGIGKTTILECLAHSFSNYNINLLKKNVSAEFGSFQTKIKNDSGSIEDSNPINISTFNPLENSYTHNSPFQHYSNKILSIKVNRTFNYQHLDAIRSDEIKDIHQSSEEAKQGIAFHNIKSWFVHRHLYSYTGTLKAEQLNNFELAKSCFQALNNEYSFSHVEPDSNDIMISSPDGIIYYEYLSSGFKSTISILFGIIKDIELRFKNPHIKADDFDGVILIDELELHLHPEWQSKIVEVLLKTFPKAQFIVSTHSPHILQNAKANQIIALSQDREDIIQRDLNAFEYGFQGWTVEEILTDIMGLSGTKTDLYKNTLQEFQVAISEENYASAQESFNKLDKMLHPSSHIRKLLHLDLVSLGEE